MLLLPYSVRAVLCVIFVCISVAYIYSGDRTTRDPQQQQQQDQQQQQQQQESHGSRRLLGLFGFGDSPAQQQHAGQDQGPVRFNQAGEVVFGEEFEYNTNYDTRSGKFFNVGPVSQQSTLSHECLHMIFPTMPRKGNPRYLIETLQSIMTRTSNMPGFCVEVTVMNVRPNTHPIFEQAKLMFANQPVRFVARRSARSVISGPVPGKWRQTIPDDVRQTNDVLEMFDDIQMNICINGRKYFMLIEDDVKLCDNAELHFMYVLRKVRARMNGDDGWTAIRVGQGLIGLLLQCRDVRAYMDYMETHILDGPVDYLLADFWTKNIEAGKAYFGNRDFVVYRYNLFKHLGRVSSFSNHAEEASGRVYHRCYDVLASLLHESEMFQPWCLHEDISPCGLPWTPSRSTNFLANSETIFRGYEAHGNIHPFLVSPYAPITNSPLFVQDFSGVSYLVGTDKSCSQTCSDYGKICDDYVLLHLNHCGMLQKHLGCERCRIATFQSQWFPGFVAPRNPELSSVNHPNKPKKAEVNVTTDQIRVNPEKDNVCYIAPILALIRCDGAAIEASDLTIKRLCPCRQETQDEREKREKLSAAQYPNRAH